MATLADYEILHAHEQQLSVTDPDKTILALKWKPPKRFVKGTNKARPVLTYQLWTHTRSEFDVHFDSDGPSGTTNHHGRRVDAGQLIVGSHVLNGKDLADKGTIRIVAKWIGDAAPDEQSRFTVEMVRIDYQVSS